MHTELRNAGSNNIKILRREQRACTNNFEKKPNLLFHVSTSDHGSKNSFYQRLTLLFCFNDFSFLFHVLSYPEHFKTILNQYIGGRLDNDPSRECIIME